MGTRSTVEVKAPTDTREWLKLVGEVAADMLNRRRDPSECHVLFKGALVASEIIHAETRRGMAEKVIGHKIQPVELIDQDLLPAPTAN